MTNKEADYVKLVSSILDWTKKIWGKQIGGNL